MEYLNENQKKIAASAISNIEDKLAAVKSEIYTREKPYKNYLMEKLDSIKWDVNVLINMSKHDSVGVDSEHIRIISDVADIINNNCSKSDYSWDEELFSKSDWYRLKGVIDTMNESAKITNDDLDVLAYINNTLYEKEDIGKSPIEKSTHEEFAQAIDVLVSRMN